jgi:Zn-dependent protease
MAYYERDYYRDDPGGGGRDLLMKILRILNASAPIGTYLRIRVRVHIMYVLLPLYFYGYSRDLVQTVTMCAMLFISVLLHEFGHCLACRRVGGEAWDILMWPLGGLAMCMPPPRPWAEFWTIAWGPLVNVILAAVSLAVLAVWHGTLDLAVSFNPLALGHGYGTGAAGLVASFFVVNYALMLFNLCLIFYPFDGGRLLQIILWFRVGRMKSLRIATSFGLVGAVVVAVWGLAVGNTLLFCIGLMGGFACWQQKQALAAGAYQSEEWQHAANEPARKPGFIAQRRQNRARRVAEREQADQHALEAEVDRILEKVHAEGIQALSAREKKILQRASEEK